jgi:hypothetical protein
VQELAGRITADFAFIHMIVDLEFPGQIQLFVDKLQQAVKTAWVHNTPSRPNAHMSVQNSVDPVHAISPIAAIFRQEHPPVCTLLLIFLVKIAHVIE